METFSALLAICAGNSPVPGEFPAKRPVTRSFDVFFDLRLNKRLSEQSWGWWFETLSRPLWRHCNGVDCNVTTDESVNLNFGNSIMPAQSFRHNYHFAKGKRNTCSESFVLYTKSLFVTWDFLTKRYCLTITRIQRQSYLYKGEDHTRKWVILLKYCG